MYGDNQKEIASFGNVGLGKFSVLIEQVDFKIGERIISARVDVAQAKYPGRVAFLLYNGIWKKII